MSKATLSKLLKYQASDNVADYLDDDELFKIGEKVINDYEIDDDSMASWREKNKDGMDIAMQVVKRKTWPWDDAANVKFPMIANGAITFASREYPQLVRGDTVVEAQVIGMDQQGLLADRARRISKTMSWQLLEDSDEWEDDTDKLLVMVAVVGTVFRKAYYDPIIKKPTFDLCRPDQITVNNNIKNLERARRISHKIYLYENDLVERMRLGIFKEYPMEELKVNNAYTSNATIERSDVRDSDQAMELIEQHRYLDLDGDGYAEPWIVTVHVNTRKVMRIKSRFDVGAEDIQFTESDEIQYIKPIHYFTDFHFLPSPDGKFFSMGFGSLLSPLNKSINTLINQLLDSGTLSNMQTGFIGAGCRLKDGELLIAPGRFNKVEGVGGMNLKENIIPLPIHDPSKVLFELLGLLIQVGNELASVSDILKGNQPTQNSPATTVLALIKQGLVQYNAIHKRILRAFKKEFNKLFYLNSLYLDISTYQQVTQDPLAVKEDWDLKSINVRPVADPNMASDLQRMAKAQAILAEPGLNRAEQLRQYLVALDAENIPLLLKTPPPESLPENQLTLAQAQLAMAQAQDVMLQQKAQAAQLELKAKDFEEQLKKNKADIATILQQIMNLQETNKNIQADTVLKYSQAKNQQEQAKHAGDKPKAAVAN